MDILEFASYGRRWRADPACPFDLAIALEFDGPQPQFFAGAAADGLYLLDPQVPWFARDAAPGRPALYSIMEVTSP